MPVLMSRVVRLAGVAAKLRVPPALIRAEEGGRFEVRLQVDQPDLRPRTVGLPDELADLLDTGAA